MDRAVQAVVVGSSPRGRGTAAAGSRPEGQSRFIPAWAGNSLLPAARLCWMAVHPRVGGEQVRATPWSAGATGSSPRGRGTGRNKMLSLDLEPVHPRVGGEQLTTFT